MKIIKWIGISLITVVLIFFLLSFMTGTEPDQSLMSGRLAEIERYIEHRDLKNSTISAADVAWQLDHTLKAINNIIRTLEASDPNNYHFNFNISRTFVFTWGDFPRGVANAPASVTPPDQISDQALRDQLEIAKKKLTTLSTLDAKSSFDHDEFGLLDRNQTVSLIIVHTDHHLKIIRDILKAEGIEVQK